VIVRDFVVDLAAETDVAEGLEFEEDCPDVVFLFENGVDDFEVPGVAGGGVGVAWD
jgi:hypothetical protein